MEKMYICKSNECVTIGDSITGNTGLGEGHQFWGYSVREAEKIYRERYGLKRKKFDHKAVNKGFFYVF